jgi:molybdopterin-binding protein
MAREISAPNILDGVVIEIGRSGNVANVTVDVGNGNYFHSYVNRDAFGRLDLKRDDRVKVIFPSSNVVLTPVEPKYTFSSPNFLQGKVEDIKENIVTLNIGNNKIVANLQPEKPEWKKGDVVRAIVRPDDVLLAKEYAVHR